MPPSGLVCPAILLELTDLTTSPIYRLVICYIAMAMAIEIVDLPTENCDFP